MKKQMFAVAALFAFASFAHAGDLAAGKAKAEAQCAACHAQNGNWNKPLDPSYPKLAGQHKDYLIQALHEYQSGNRNNAIMGGQAATLNDKDIENLATYLSSLNGDLYLKK